MRVASAASADTFSATHLRMKAHTSCACAGVATLPVPMAHTGSYAICAAARAVGGGQRARDEDAAGARRARVLP